jgi:hypothetical protein
MKPKTQDHVHKYKLEILGDVRVKRVNGKKLFEKVGGYPIYRCVLPDCPHYVPMMMAVGRKSICWKCGNEMVLTIRNIKTKKPKHRECVLGV